MTDSRLVPLAPASALPLEVQAELEELLATGTELTANRHAELTRKAYESDFTHFADWCGATTERTGSAVSPLPADAATVWLYLFALVEADNAAAYKVATLERRLSAIKWVHDTNGHPSPTTHTRVHELMAGIRRTYGARPEKVDPLTTDQLARIVSNLDLNTLSGLRDRALLLFGHAGAFRRSELVGLDRDQLHPTISRSSRIW